MARPPRISGLAPAQGRQGTVLRCVVTGTGLASATLGFSGTGIRAERSGHPSARQAEFILHIAPDAAPGPRDTALDTAWSGTLFLVLPATGYGSRRGIGSHLI